MNGNFLQFEIFGIILAYMPLDPPFKDSTTAVITFVVSNHVDKAKQRKAKAWEAAMIDFMKEYVEKETEMSDNMEIAFSTERSIEDELDRQSRSDIVIIVASYVIMFLYIAVALGEQHSLKRLPVSPVEPNLKLI